MLRFPDGRLRRRDGFALTDPGDDLAGALDEIHYCILCHHQGKDSCSRGMRDRATGAFAVNPLGTAMTGCPLEEKISEMHEVKGQGLAVAALAMAVVDNPMVAGTGHRICNDCMTACIYHNQNKEPVDIPQAETRALKDVLSLPWGVEIYGLLTRWNPLDLRRPCRARTAAARCWWWAGTRRLHPGPPPAQRRAHGGRRRRVEDRTAGA